MPRGGHLEIDLIVMPAHKESFKFTMGAVRHPHFFSSSTQTRTP